MHYAFGSTWIRAGSELHKRQIAQNNIYTNYAVPTGNLDSKTSDEVIALLKMTAKKYGQTIVMITHDDEIAQVADRILVIEDGQVVDFR